MPGFPRPFSTDDADDETFDDYDEFRPDHLPDPGPFLAEADVLTGDDHADFHQRTRDIFEERGVYDATFGYNLARLNLDSRHPDAGWRYAVAPDDAPASGESGDGKGVLLAEFTPTTEFCPQSDSLTVGAFRAWNGLSDRHEYVLVRVAVSPMHHQSTEINEKLRGLEGSLGDGGDNIEIEERSTDVAEELKDSSDDDPLPF
ncbi:hypothetical protein [Halorussus lipolyticus]|uniref:hypothetical protein n=1 Tax=Halorussus lipolyticus TaxID=3034024 RepID=UPI0023E8720B|nr:hypothetical protein [Halorussus sp. DT80]